MNDNMKEALQEEIDFIRGWMEYPDYELTKMETLEEARAQIDGMKLADDYPDGLWEPEIVLLVWNYCIDESK